MKRGARRASALILLTVLTALTLMVWAPQLGPLSKVIPHVAEAHAAGITQQNTCTSGTSGVTSLTCSFSSAVSQNDLLIVLVAGYLASSSAPTVSVSDSLGNSYTGVAPANQYSSSTGYTFFSEVFSASSYTGGSDTVTVSLSASSYLMVHIIDAPGYTPVSPTTSTGTGSGTSMSVTNFTTHISSLVVGVASAGALPNSCSPPTGFTCGYNSDGISPDIGSIIYIYDTNHSEESTALPTSWSGTGYLNEDWVMSAASFQLLVTQPVTFTVAPSGQPADTILLSGCSASPASIPTSDNGVTVDLTATAGCTITAILSSSTAANTRYVFSNGGTSVGITACISLTCATYSATYYYQDAESFAYSVADGGSGYSAPTLSYTQYGGAVSATLSTTATTYWLDAGTSWSVTNPLTGSTSTERWYANANTGGTASAGASITPTYYNQYAFTVSYSVVDGGTGYSAPTLSGTQFGSAYTVTLSSTQQQTVWLDATTTWSITNPLSGSSTSERWYTPAATSGTVSAAATLNPSYYNQYNVVFQLSYANSVSGLTLSAPTVGATQFGSAYTVTVPTSGSVSAWLDATTQWTLNTLVIYQNAAGTQRVATTPQSGSVTAAATVTFTYYDQFLVNVQGLNTQYTEFGTTYTGTTSLTNQWVDAGSLLYTSGDYSYQWPVTMALYVYQASSGMQLAVNVSASNLAWNPSTYTLTWTAPTSYDQVYVPSSLGLTPASVTDNGVSITFKWTGTLLTFTGSSNFVVTFSASVVNTGSTQTSYTGVGQSTTSYTFVTGSCSPQNLPPSPLGMMEQGCFAPAIIDVYATTIGVPVLFIILELLFGSMVFIKTQNPVAGALIALLIAIVFPFMFPSSIIESVIVIGVAAFASAIYFAFNRQE